MTIRQCKVEDCLSNDKKGNCTTEAEIDDRGKCITYTQDKKWLDEQLHNYIWMPVFEGYSRGTVPVSVEKLEGLRERRDKS